MQLPLRHADFAGQELAVETGGWLRGPRLLRAGAPVAGKRRVYPVETNRGVATELRLRSSFLDPVPLVRYGNEIIRLARPLTWYEYLWIGLPILLVGIGGAFGAICGIVATGISARLLRGEQPLGTRYVLSGLVTVAAVVTYLALAVAFQTIVGA